MGSGVWANCDLENEIWITGTGIWSLGTGITEKKKNNRTGLGFSKFGKTIGWEMGMGKILGWKM